MIMLRLGREIAGLLSGLALSPLVGLVTLARGGRPLHPSGIVLEGQAEPFVTRGPEGELARSLRGPVLARFSGAWWKHREWPDVLGCALRFRSRTGPDTTPEPTDQDLLFATARSPFTLPFAPLSTRRRDYLANTYFAISPFDTPGLERVWFRLVSREASALGDTRAERLRTRLHDGPAVLHLQMAQQPGAYTSLLRLSFNRPVMTDQDRLRFDPFRTGRGIEPRGAVHHVRIATYAISQRMRGVRAASLSRSRASRGARAQNGQRDRP